MIIKRVKIFLIYIFSTLINEGFKNHLNRFLSLLFMGSTVLFVFSKNIRNDFLVILIFSLIFSISIKRVSNNFILSFFTGHLSMSLLNSKEYKKIGYRKNKEKISKKLKENFIIGIITASKYRKILRFNTHKWFVENVLTDEKNKG